MSQRSSTPGPPAADGPISVLLITPNVEGTGGAERSLLATLPYCADRQVAVTVVVFSQFNTPEAPIVAAGAELIDLSHLSGRRQLIVALRSLIKQRRPDLIHTVLGDADLVGRLAAWGLGIPTMSSMVTTAPRWSDLPTTKHRLARLLDIATARWANDHTHAVTSGVRDTAIQRLKIAPDRISVVERGRDPESLGVASPQRRAEVRARLSDELPGIGDDTPLVLAAGRHYPAKDHPSLLDAIGRLQCDRPELRLLLAGSDGPMTEAIEAARRALPDPDRVHALGHRDDVADLMAAADVFVSPSRVEGAAGAVVEALGVGVPVVSTDVEGLRGELRDGVELVTVPVSDPAALAAGIARILDDRNLAEELVRHGRAAFESRYVLTVNGPRLVELQRAVATRTVPGRWKRALVDPAPTTPGKRSELTEAERILFDRYVPAGADIGDLGVGTGRTTSALTTTLTVAGGSYLGIDLSESAVDAARAAFPEVRFEVGDATQLDGITDASTDVVVFSFNGLDEIRPLAARRQCLAEVARILRPGGVFILSTHNARALIRPLQWDPSTPAAAARSVAVWAVTSGRLAVRQVRSGAWRKGEGYNTDSVYAVARFGSTPAKLGAELGAAGFEPLDTMGESFLHQTRILSERHWHAAYRRTPSVPSISHDHHPEP